MPPPCVGGGGQTFAMHRQRTSTAEHFLEESMPFSVLCMPHDIDKICTCFHPKNSMALFPLLTAWRSLYSLTFFVIYMKITKKSTNVGMCGLESGKTNHASKTTLTPAVVELLGEPHEPKRVERVYQSHSHAPPVIFPRFP